MKYYFKLQIDRSKRMIINFGLNPIIGFILSGFLFVILSKFLFLRSEYAGYIYLFIQIFILAKLSNKKRNEFMALIFNKKNYRLVRLLENTILTIPFSAYLIFETHYYLSLFSLLISITMSFLQFKKKINFVIPTPFKRFPFEYIIGFRTTFYIYLFSYFLLYKGLQVDNFYLCLFSMAISYIISIMYFFVIEDIHFVWIFSKNSNVFLMKKFQTSIICTSIMISPIFIVLVYFYPSKLLLIFGVIVLGIIYLSLMIFAKYSSFPNEMNIRQGLLYGACLIFPPFILFAIPYFYINSKQSLERILE